MEHKMDNILYIDVETIKCINQEIIDRIISNAKDNIKPSANCKSEEAREKSLEKQRKEFNAEDIIEKTVFNPSYGELITIGYAFNDGNVNALQRDGYVDERSILQTFFDNIAAYADTVNIPVKLITIRWVAHNKSFDFGYIYKRAVILNINTHGLRIPFNDRHGTKYAYCTLEAWSGFPVKPGGSLDELCFLLGFEGKGDMDGSKVWDSWAAKEYDKISKYCKQDVEMLRKIYKRQLFLD